jgi:hypothetical protein
VGRPPSLLSLNDVPRSAEAVLQLKPSYSRRALTRFRASEDIWVCWRCNDREDVSRVLDISIDGLFIETLRLKLKEGMPAKLDFLVQEGSIKADAVVRHVKDGSGLGLRFLAVPDEDRQRLKALLRRLRSLPTALPQYFRSLQQE